MTSDKQLVFVSYSRKDRPWLDRLRTTLEPLARSGRIEVWDDSQIESGKLWREETERLMEKAHVAILLVTPDFLASEFVVNIEIPLLLARAENDGLRLFWIPIKHSLVEESQLSQYQAAWPMNQPLDSLSGPEQDRALVEIVRKISKGLPLSSGNRDPQPKDPLGSRIKESPKVAPIQTPNWKEEALYKVWFRQDALELICILMFIGFLAFNIISEQPSPTLLLLNVIPAVCLFSLHPSDTGGFFAGAGLVGLWLNSIHHEKDQMLSWLIWLGFPLLILSLLLLAKWIYTISTSKLKVTRTHVIYRNGPFHAFSTQFPHDRIQAIFVKKQGLFSLGRWFDYGTLVVQQVGKGEIRVPMTPLPNYVCKKIKEIQMQSNSLLLKELSDKQKSYVDMVRTMDGALGVIDILLLEEDQQLLTSEKPHSTLGQLAHYDIQSGERLELKHLVKYLHGVTLLAELPNKLILIGGSDDKGNFVQLIDRKTYRTSGPAIRFKIPRRHNDFRVELKKYGFFAERVGVYSNSMVVAQCGMGGDVSQLYSFNPMSGTIYAGPTDTQKVHDPSHILPETSQDWAGVILKEHRWYVTGSRWGWVRTWDAGTLTLLHHLQLQSPEGIDRSLRHTSNCQIHAMAVNGSETTIAVGTWVGAIHLLNAPPEADVVNPLVPKDFKYEDDPYSGDASEVTALLFLDNERFLVAAYKSSLRIWDTETGLQVGDPFGRDESGTIVSIVQCGEYLITFSDYGDNQLVKWRLKDLIP